MGHGSIVLLGDARGQASCFLHEANIHRCDGAGRAPDRMASVGVCEWGGTDGSARTYRPSRWLLATTLDDLLLVTLCIWKIPRC